MSLREYSYSCAHSRHKIKALFASAYFSKWIIFQVPSILYFCHAVETSKACNVFFSGSLLVNYCDSAIISSGAETPRTDSSCSSLTAPASGQLFNTSCSQEHSRMMMMVGLAKQIHNDIITISKDIKSIFNLVYCVFCLFCCKCTRTTSISRRYFDMCVSIFHFLKSKFLWLSLWLSWCPYSITAGSFLLSARLLCFAMKMWFCWQKFSFYIRERTFQCRNYCTVLPLKCWYVTFCSLSTISLPL